MSIRKGSTVIASGKLTPEYVRNMHDPDWSQAETITAAELYAGYTATKRGIACILGRPSSSDSFARISINGVYIGDCYNSSSGGFWDTNIQAPMCVGDIIKSTVAIAKNFTGYFVPYKEQ